MKRIIFSSFILLTSFIAFAQTRSDVEPTVPSGETFAFSKAGEIPVSLFTGQVDIQIPLTTIENGPLKLDLSLNYDSGGVKVTSKPTWVGLNWYLNAGGVIRRQTNGFFDEYYPATYLDKRATLSPINWNTVAFMNSLSSEYRTSLAPDEFSFNFNGISGSIVLNHEGYWAVKTKSNVHLRVSHVVTNDFPLMVLSQSRVLDKAITSFTIITDDGTKYLFGEALEAMEYSWGEHPTEVQFGPKLASSLHINAWHLTSIVAPSGQKIDFNYLRSWTTQLNSATTIDRPRMNAIIPDYINYPQNFATFTPYLTSITSNNGITCLFNKSAAAPGGPQGPVISPPIRLGPPPANQLLVAVPDYTSYRLDGIQVKVNGLITNNIGLSYLQLPDARRKLQKVRFLSPDGSKSRGEYVLEYNPKALPAYTSALVDHWGFYNGKNFWNIYKQQYDTPIPDEAQYYQSREADGNYMDAEVLQRMKYPTGGFTDFVYEPHEYSKHVRLSDVLSNPLQLSVEDYSTNKIAGGLRIKKISTYESASSTPIVKEYIYNTNSINGGTKSSGVLAMKPMYLDTYNYPDGDLQKRFSSFAFNYLRTSGGNHITYTEVTEKTEQGYIVNTFTNHDNGYLNKPAFACTSIFPLLTLGYDEYFASLDLERGFLLNRKVFGKNKALLQELINEYNSDPNRYNNYVKSISFLRTSNYGHILAALPIYTFYPYLKKSTTKEYFNAVAIINQKEFTYSDYRQLLSEKSTDSNGDVTELRYKYPSQIYTGQNSEGINGELYDLSLLLDNNIINIPVEVVELKTRDNIQYVTGGRLNLFEDLKLEKVLELNSSNLDQVSNTSFALGDIYGFHYNSNYKEKLHNYKYNSKGNILEQRSSSGPTKVYLWGYKNAHPFCEISNATYAEVTSVIGVPLLNDLELSFTDSQFTLAVNQLRSALPNAQITSYTYLPRVGVLTKILPNNMKISYEYDEFGRLLKIKDNDSLIIEEHVYNTAN